MFLSSCTQWWYDITRGSWTSSFNVQTTTLQTSLNESRHSRVLITRPTNDHDSCDRNAPGSASLHDLEIHLHVHLKLSRLFIRRPPLFFRSTPRRFGRMAHLATPAFLNHLKSLYPQKPLPDCTDVYSANRVLLFGN